MPEPKTLLFDIENSPILAYVWQLWEADVVAVERDWFCLSFAYKWLGDKKVTTHALPDYPLYRTNKLNDKSLMEDLWKLLDGADIVVAHNAKRFDVKKVNTRFLIHGMQPPSPYKVVDTLVEAKKSFANSSNKLDSLGKSLGVGRKLPHTGIHLWLSCIAGDPKAWSLMRRYNAQDVALLERVYLKLRPWSTSHPNLNHFTRADACPVCRSPTIVCQGFSYLNTGKRQRKMCKDCGHRFVAGKLIKDAA